MTLFILVYAVHVMAAIVWFGGGLTSVLVTGPALSTVSRGAAAELGPAIGRFAKRIYPPAGVVTVVAGATLGILNGRIASFADLGTPYGVTICTALVLSLAVFGWGEFVIGPASAKIGTLPAEARSAATTRLIHLVATGQCGFLVVFSCMVLMRFGL